MIQEKDHKKLLKVARKAKELREKEPPEKKCSEEFYAFQAKIAKETCRPAADRLASLLRDETNE